VRDRGARLRSALAIAASAGAMTVGSYMSWDTLWLVWVGLTPWLASVDAAANWRAGGQAAGLGMCVAFTLGIFWWFGVAVEHYAGLPRGSWLAITLPARRLCSRSSSRRRWLAGSRCGAAAEPSSGPGDRRRHGWEPNGSFPSCSPTRSAHGFLPARTMRQAADAIGVPGLTVVVLLANEAALSAFRGWRAGDRRRTWRAATAIAGLAALLLLYGTWRLRAIAVATEHAPALTVGVVQGGFADYARLREAHGSFEATRRILNRYFRLSEAARASAQLLVWPETVYPTTFGHPKSEDGAAFDRALARFVQSTGMPLVFGGYDLGRRRRRVQRGDPARAGPRGRGRHLRRVPQDVALSTDRARSRMARSAGRAPTAAVARNVEGWRWSDGAASSSKGCRAGAHRAARLLRRRRSVARACRRTRGCGADRHLVERLVVRARSRHVAASGGLGVPHHRDAPGRRYAPRPPASRR
jgi:hypothetical protein